MSEALVVCAFLVLWVVLVRWQASRTREVERRHRRVGWIYGYGAGLVDGKRGMFNPEPPFDTRALALICCPWTWLPPKDPS